MVLQSAPSELKDCVFVDAEDCKGTSDLPVPMSVQHTEAMLEEIDRMEEIEMEDLVKEPVMDIDGSDNKNSLAVVEYIDEIYAYYRKTEVIQNLLFRALFTFRFVFSLSNA